VCVFVLGELLSESRSGVSGSGLASVSGTAGIVGGHSCGWDVLSPGNPEVREVHSHSLSPHLCPLVLVPCEGHLFFLRYVVISAGVVVKDETRSTEILR